MTRIDFYIMDAPQGNRQPLLACKLAEKAYRQGHEVFINTASDTQLQQLDDMLWTFRAGSFVPHDIYRKDMAGTSPVMLGHTTEPADCHDVLVNLANDVPPWFGQFDRVAELVGGDDSQRAAARRRYRFYQDRGYTLKSHHI
ncbi:MAG: DNA polymerase III subunit chi [Gammaproteobacteria bacterium]|nr:MAG: DNA polymerase III subunit chi [Gammaproteobacteria bacterium]